MDMHAAAIAPRSPHINATDRTHPLFPSYQQHFSGMRQLLCEAGTFSDWLYQYEMHKT